MKNTTEKEKIYGSSKVANDDYWHIGFRNKTLCAKQIQTTARGIIEATCPICIKRYQMIIEPENQ